MDTEKNRFLYKIIPPRPTFTQDMTEAERKVMQEHATYWKRLIDDSIAIIFGLDPRGPWRVGIVDVANKSDACALGTNDPAVKAGLTFDVSPMPVRQCENEDNSSSHLTHFQRNRFHRDMDQQLLFITLCVDQQHDSRALLVRWKMFDN
jgi:hypothetical protein